jgi:hypothetical protein
LCASQACTHLQQKEHGNAISTGDAVLQATYGAGGRQVIICQHQRTKAIGAAAKKRLLLKPVTGDHVGDVLSWQGDVS